MTRRTLLALIVLGCVVTQTAVNLQQMKLNDSFVRTAETQAAGLLLLNDRVGKLEQRQQAAGPVPHVEVGRGLAVLPAATNSWAPPKSTAELFPQSVPQPRRLHVTYPAEPKKE